jgi:3-phenylpropionate/trans-cinnamate dioxygenase ferredoxin reductase subunit
MAMEQTFAIVGAGQCGAWVARTLRAEGFEGRIVLIGAESHPPYERPPLSKAVLSDPAAETGTTLLDFIQAAEARIELWLGTEVTSFDRQSRLLRCSDGRKLVYDRLFLTMGSRPRWPAWLPEAGSARIHRLRTLDDAGRLRGALAASRSLLIVGGGWIGLEVAASARQRGVAVTVYEAADRVCARSLPPALSEWLANLHRDKEVVVELGASIVAVEEEGDAVTLELADGTRVTGDHLLVGVGNYPETALAEAAGLKVDNGIVVDAGGRTSDPSIYAAGDVANLPCTLSGGQTRRESWANAQNQAIVVARAALGHDVIYDEIPWLWSDQYDVNIQMIGLPERAVRLLLRPGKKPGSGCWLALDGNDIPVGAVAIDAGREIRMARKLIQGKEPIITDEWMKTGSIH